MKLGEAGERSRDLIKKYYEPERFVTLKFVQQLQNGLSVKTSFYQGIQPAPVLKLQSSGKTGFQYSQDRLNVQVQYLTQGIIKSKANLILPYQNGLHSKLFVKAKTQINNRVRFEEVKLGSKFDKEDIYGQLFWKQKDRENYLGGRFDANLVKQYNTEGEFNCGIGGKFQYDLQHKIFSLWKLGTWYSTPSLDIVIQNKLNQKNQFFKFDEVVFSLFNQINKKYAIGVRAQRNINTQQNSLILGGEAVLQDSIKLKGKIDDQFRVGASLNCFINPSVRVIVSTWTRLNLIKQGGANDGDIFPISLRFDIGE